MTTAGYQIGMAEIRMGDFDDPWGTTLEWLFALASVAYVRYGEIYPEFIPGPLLTEESIRNDSDYSTVFLLDMIDSGEIVDQDLRKLYSVMSLYANVVKAAGRDY